MSQDELIGEPTPAQIDEEYAKAYEDNSAQIPHVMCRYLLKLCDTSGPFPSPITSHSIIHDNASGPGILAGEVIQLPQFAVENVPKIYCTDSNPTMIKVLDAKGWSARYGVETSIMGGEELSFPDNKFTHSFTNFAIFLFADPAKGTKEIYRTLQPRGIAFVTTFKVTGWLPPFQKAQKRVRPDEEPYPGMLPTEWSEPAHLKKLMLEGGFVEESLVIQSFKVSYQMKIPVNQPGQPIAFATERLTKEWSDEETEQFKVALQDEFRVYVEGGSPLHHEIWIAIGKK